MPRRGTAKRKRIVERRRTTVTAVEFKYANGTTVHKIRRKVLKRKPPLRVYPYEQTPILRSNQTQDEILAKMRKENLTDEN
ncbi:unnamed protein product [Didymodactylos carnosus]|nr:unnamed protein product [Didymodactylos carnosus]CAF4385188.1 unnamed protein product [Didymodactylos carnosus]